MFLLESMEGCFPGRVIRKPVETGSKTGTVRHLRARDSQGFPFSGKEEQAMSNELRPFLQGRHLKAKVTTMVVAAFFVGGLAASSGLNPGRLLAVPDAAQAAPAEGDQPGVTPTSPFATLAAKLTPVVVNVRVTKIERAEFPDFEGPEQPFGDFFRHFFGDRRGFPNVPAQGAGSGVIIRGDGYVLTNNHVVEGAREVTVTLSDKQEHKARVVGRDAKTDLALLKIEAGKSLPAASLGDSDQLKVGDWVMAIGNPFGLSETVTSGIVSAKGRVIGAGPYDDFIQTDASINPGNSGGPLFNMKGEVVGINTAIIPNAQGIGFAIPVNTAKPLIPQLETKGEVTRGYLGVSIQSITPDLASAMGLGDGKGALVADVVEGGPADRAGIRRGDVILAFGGKDVKDSHDLSFMVAAAPVGRESAVTIMREGVERRLDVKIGKQESEEGAKKEFSKQAHGKWGLQLRDVPPRVAEELGLESERGALVAGVLPGSPADRAALRQGDVILEVNRQPVRSASELKERIAGAGERGALVLLVQSSRGTRYVVLKG